MKKAFFLIPFITLSLLILSCGGGTGTITLNITDAPADADNVEQVFLKITGIGYHEGDDETDDWNDIVFDNPKEFDILSKTNGLVEMLGQFELPAGTITQLRFYLDAKETGSSTPANPGCYIVLTDATEHDLFIPSGGTSGFMATGSFDVPINGEVTLTADFDMRKSLKLTNSTYNLQPTIRIIADNQAGKISGTVSYNGSYSLVVFAYEDGEYSDSEATTADSAGFYFTNAVTSATVDATSGNYVLAFLAAGTYDLIFVEVDDLDGSYVSGSAKESADVIVASELTTTRDFIY